MNHASKIFAILLLLSSCAYGENWCGRDWSDAFKCQTQCPGGLDSQCPSGENCYADVTCSSGSGGASAEGGEFSGDMTYYDPSVGQSACGPVFQQTDFVAAISLQRPRECEKCAVIHYQGKSVKVQVRDRCGACKIDDIDVSPIAFRALAPQQLGRVRVTWSFTTC